jgi:enamine deaminase RidA (YjgF/YER057c/UK114 family)
MFETMQRLARRLRECQAQPLHMLVFGSLAAAHASEAVLKDIFGRMDWPMTWVEGKSCSPSSIAGIQTFCFTGKIERVALDGKIVASVFADGGTRQCVVGGLSSRKVLSSHSIQTGEALENLQTVLALAGFDLSDTFRTWFYLDDILSWYRDFNEVRTKIYDGLKFRSGSLPASTGIGAKNPAGGAVALSAWALKPLASDTGAKEVASPRQCPAPAYGSSFSRAMELVSSSGGQLLISGTASIAPAGATVWPGDARQQLALTMEVVDAILHSRGCTFADVTRAVAYFKNSEDAGLLRKWCQARRLEDLPVVVTQADVCRDDLLFELEADAERRNAVNDRREVNLLP